MQRRILRIGVPAAADAGLMWVAQMAFITIVSYSGAGALADANYAAHMIAMRMEAISFLPAVAWMTAASTLVGQYLGAGQPALAARSGHRAALQASVLTGLVGVAFFVLADAIYAFMSNDPLVRQIGGRAFRYIAFVQPLLGMAIVYIGALRGAGDVRATLLFSVVGGLLLRVPGAWFFGVYMGWGLLGCWLGMWLDNIAKFACGLARFRHGGWQRVRV
jgi:Na+-driven multidrug efflux pump